MKTFLTVLFAGAMLATAGFAASSDPFAEERFKMKTGRYTPAEEARRQALVQKADAAGMDCMEMGCCHRARVSTTEHSAFAAAGWAEQVFKVKWGRNTSSEEARLVAGRSRAVPVEVGKGNKVTGEAGYAFSDAWQRAKWGRSLAASDDRPRVQSLRAQVLAPAAAATNMCDQPACCQ